VADVVSGAGNYESDRIAVCLGETSDKRASKTFVWAKTGDQILENIARFGRRRTLDSCSVPLIVQAKAVRTLGGI